MQRLKGIDARESPPSRSIRARKEDGALLTAVRLKFRHGCFLGSSLINRVSKNAVFNYQWESGHAGG